jgi:dTMP kinase
MPAVLITIEGVEGSGKSTQCARLEQHLLGRGLQVVRTSEPDGTPLGLRVRALFEAGGPTPTPLAQTFLFMAARQEHVTRVIAPALARGAVVISDRYADATVAYQGYGRGLDPELIRELNVRATGGVLPDLTLLFDLDPAVGFRRIGRRRDHFERLTLGFHRRVRRGYLEIQRAEPKRVRVIDAAATPTAIAAQVQATVGEFLRGA